MKICRITKALLVLSASVMLLFAFSLCAGADTLRIPDGVRTIAAEAFYGDRSITEVYLPDSVETIGARAFAGTGITRIRLSSGLKSIAGTAFSGITEMDAEAEEGTWADI